jgi:acyl-CoA synthetase (AMP-forming)/AMP-acid ligase II
MQVICSSEHGPCKCWNNCFWDGEELIHVAMLALGRNQIGIHRATATIGCCLISATNIFSCYLPTALKHALIKQGWWACAGDIVELTPSGALKVVDRKKALLKLSQGEYVALERLEAVYKGGSAAEQIMVTGDPTKRRLVAVVVPNHKWCAADWHAVGCRCLACSGVRTGGRPGLLVPSTYTFDSGTYHKTWNALPTCDVRLSRATGYKN